MTHVNFEDECEKAAKLINEQVAAGKEANVLLDVRASCGVSLCFDEPVTARDVIEAILENFPLQVSSDGDSNYNYVAVIEQ
jgi:hypothetical protein